MTNIKFLGGMIVVHGAFYLRRKALRVIPRGEQWLEVYRAHQVDVNNGHFFMKIVQKNCHSSKSLNSFGLGPIYFESLGQELSRNAFVVSVYAFSKKIDRSKDFFVTPLKVEIFMKS